jgi:two-component system, NarL family, nitrate/nitrite response regulator NarL
MSGNRSGTARTEPISAAPTMAASQSAAAQPRVLIVSDVKLYREGLAWSLLQRREMTVVGTCTPNMEALEQIAGASPTTVLLDFATPGALNIPKELNRLWPGIKVVAFAVSEIEHELIACAEAGIQGFVTRDGSVDDLVTAVLGAQRGEVFCSPRLTALLFKRVAALFDAVQGPPARAALTRREREIVELVNAGLSNKEIALSLKIGSATVKNHVHSILEKLNVTRRGEAAARLRGTPWADGMRHSPTLASAAAAHQQRRPVIDR